ncbi:MAG: Na+/H+ antiporter NhaA, partial [Desulfomonilaceae bacterium]
TPLKVFVTALAIVDDIGAVAVIAIFYSSDLSINYLILTLFLIALLVCFNFLGYRKPMPYIVVGIFVWLSIYLSGVHSTIAGVLVAFTIPARTRRDMPQFLDRLKSIVSRLTSPDFTGINAEAEENCQTMIDKIEGLCKDVQTPLQRMEATLNPWVEFLIVPLFALANAGVLVSFSDIFKALNTPVALGIIVGLLLGKQVGIFVASWIAVRLKLAELPTGVTFFQIYGSSILCGIGFTMSIFVADLAFGQSTNLDYAKVSILTGSSLSFCIGFLVLSVGSRASQNDGQPAQDQMS